MNGYQLRKARKNTKFVGCPFSVDTQERWERFKQELLSLLRGFSSIIIRQGYEYNMMNLEKTIRGIWDFFPQLEAKIPQERVTVGPPGKGDIPYVTIEIDRCEPNLLTNKGHLRERFELHLQLRHNDYADARWIVDYLHDILKNRMIFDTDSMLQAQTSLTKTTIKKLDTQTWLFTIGLMVDANQFSITTPV